MAGFFGYCDLCVNANENNPDKLRRVLTRLYELGYETVAINQTVDESIFENEKKKKTKTVDNETVKNVVPEPLALTELKTEFAKKLKLLSRITFLFSDTTKVHTLAQSQILKKYDLYAVVPKNQAAFQFACSQLIADVVTLKPSYPGLKFTRKLYQQATERGLHFEIQYVDVLDHSTRKYALHFSHLFHIFGKSKNVVVSSGTANETFLRSPYDIINLASLLGLDETKAKASVLGQCKYLLTKAEGRRYGKAVFSIFKNAGESEKRKKTEREGSAKKKKES